MWFLAINGIFKKQENQLEMYFVFIYISVYGFVSWCFVGKKKKVTILVGTTRKGSSELRSAGAIKQFASVSELFAYVENQQATWNAAQSWWSLLSSLSS